MTSVVGPTRTGTAVDWTLNGEVIQFRRWGIGTFYPLPQPPVDECTIGSAKTCAIRIVDPASRISRLHARLVRDHNRWFLHDLDSKNGIWVDGSLRSRVLLSPGLEIAIGGVTLIAESARSIALASFLARLLGWASDRGELVDHALRAVRLAATRRTALVVCGDGDLAHIARSIHRRSRGSGRPFIVCDPRRRRGKATVRSAENYATGMEALAAATGGSICMRSVRLPPDFPDFTKALRNPASQVQLIVCAESADDCELCQVRPIVIPPLASRGDELERIIQEYAEDALTELELPPSGFLPADASWVHEHAATSLPEIEKATLRLAALRASPNVSRAAARLGMASVSLSRWIGRRRMPMEIKK